MEMDRDRQHDDQSGGYTQAQGTRSQQRQGSQQTGGRQQSGGYQQGGGYSSQARGGRQPSQHGGHAAQYGAAQYGQRSHGTHPLHSMAEVALRGTALLWDLQMETARNLWRTQARTAAMLGVPDYSELFRIGDDRARRLFSAGAAQVLNSARQAHETVVEMQRQIGRLAEQQTIGITEEVRENIQQIGRDTEQGLQEIKQMAAAEIDRAEGYARQQMNEEDEDREQQQGERQQREASSESERGWQAPGEEGAQPTNGEMQQRPEASAGAEGETEPDAANEARVKRRQEERPRGRRAA